MSGGFVYLDSSVALAHVLAEPRRPHVSLWGESLIASRLLAYESWVVINQRGLAQSHGEVLRSLLGRVAMLEPVEPIVGTVVTPGGSAPRTLDALHLASMRFLVEHGQDVRLATYDRRLATIAETAGIPLYPL